MNGKCPECDGVVELAPDTEEGEILECPDCGLKVRVGRKDDPRLVHDVCSEKKGEKVFLVQHDGLKHTIFEGGDSEAKLSGNLYHR